MATPLYDPKLSGAKFKNWIKAGLGVLFTKEGIEPFVHDEIEQFQQKCLSDICNNNGLATGTTCSCCCTENVVVCPTNRICNARRGLCNFHRNSATQYLPSGCPNRICHNFKSEIQHAHRYHGPSYKNTDATKWCSNPWEVAKCFMPPDGYTDATNAADTDFNGIISVIMNYKAFQTKIHDDLSKPNNIFEQGREVGKAVRHCPQLEMEDTDLQHIFSVLQNLLSDPAHLSGNTVAQNAKTKLLQLQNDTLVIGKDDVRKVLDDVCKEVQDKIRTIDRHGKVSMSQLDKALKSAMDEIEKQTKESVIKVQAEAGKQLKIMAEEGDTIAKKVIEGVQGIDAGIGKVSTETDNAKRKITQETDQEVKRLKAEASARINTLKREANTKVKMVSSEAGKAVKQIEGAKDEGLKAMKTVAEAEVKKINLETDEALKKIKKSKTDGKEDIYNTLKRELKDDLATFYKTRYSTIPLSPLVEGHDTPLVDFYILPEMNFIEKQDKKPAGKETKTPVKSLSEVFQSEKQL
ncbi:uncharacterized protein LOC128549485 [Mercenaria mercenaria]|uniref:uncharacterized protein LOC128549485 n=1 Tax=Mercenaria mercenaria TaxID=6596 RepID=UPI00234E98A7|nr:uncharacterized protein LOC128549485 [Mercenaria mercenaria]